MQQVSEIIMNKIPTISGIATILLIIYIIIYIYTDWNVVLELCSRIWNLYGTCQKSKSSIASTITKRNPAFL